MQSNLADMTFEEFKTKLLDSFQEKLDNFQNTQLNTENNK